MGDPSDITFDEDDDGLVWFKSPNDRSGKCIYFDISSQVVVPKLTEYKVKYTITYNAIKYRISGSSTTGITMRAYDFGSDTLDDGSPINAENLYNNGTNLSFATYTNVKSELNEYWTGNVLNTSSPKRRK